jgi:hypothetical protein
VKSSCQAFLFTVGSWRYRPRFGCSIFLLDNFPYLL